MGLQRHDYEINQQLSHCFLIIGTRYQHRWDSVEGPHKGGGTFFCWRWPTEAGRHPEWPNDPVSWSRLLREVTFSLNHLVTGSALCFAVRSKFTPVQLYNEMVQGSCAHLGFLMLGHGDYCGRSHDKCSVGWLMSTKLEHSRSNNKKTNQLVLANLKHSKSNSNKTSQLCNMFWTLTSVTLKSRSNQNLGIMSCTLYHCLDMIQPLVQES
jgi:hypothetical protein